MNRAFFLGSIALAFVAGATATRLLHSKRRPPTDLTPMIIHVPDLSGDALGMASGTGFRSKAFVVQDGMTLGGAGRQCAEAPAPRRQRDAVHPRRHRHDLARRQGSEGQARRSRDHPEGHRARRHQAGRGSAPFKAIAIKTPPQAPDDTKLLN